MTDDKKKMTAQGSSVGADDGQSISQNSKFTIPDPDKKSNSPERDLEELYRKMRRMSDPAYLHTVTLDELMDNVFEGKSAVIENLLYTGAYILAESLYLLQSGTAFFPQSLSWKKRKSGSLFGAEEIKVTAANRKNVCCRYFYFAFIFFIRDMIFSLLERTFSTDTS